MAQDQRDVIEILEHDHREVEEMFRELEALRGAATDEDRERRELVTEQVTIELVRHAVAEEVIVYPRVEDMREVLDPEELRALGTAVEAFKKVAPTRPHPNVPNEALPRLAAGPMASLFDRFRDLASGRGKE